MPLLSECDVANGSAIYASWYAPGAYHIVCEVYYSKGERARAVQPEFLERIEMLSSRKHIRT